MPRDDELEKLHLIDDDHDDLVGRSPKKAAKPVKKVAKVTKKAAPKKVAKRPAAKKPAPRTNAIKSGKPRGRPRKNPA